MLVMKAARSLLCIYVFMLPVGNGAQSHRLEAVLHCRVFNSISITNGLRYAWYNRHSTPKQRFAEHLPREFTSRLWISLVMCRLDCSHSVLSGASNCSLQSLQLALYMAARLAFMAMSHACTLLDQLTCPPIEKRIARKFLVLVFWARNGPCRSNITDKLHAYVPARLLRSSETPSLEVSNCMLETVGDRSTAQ